MLKNRATRAVVALAAAALIGFASSCTPATEAAKTYAVTLSQATGGTIASSAATAAEGDTVILTVTPAAHMKLMASGLKINAGATPVAAGTVNTYSFAMPALAVTVTAAFAYDPMIMNFEATPAAVISEAPGTGNTMAAGSFAAAVVASSTEGGYVDLPLDSSSGQAGRTWVGAAPDLGAKVLSFQYGTDAANGHVVLSFKNVDFGALAGRTGIQFLVKAPDIHAFNAGGGMGIATHIRYNDGANANAGVFVSDWWAYQLADAVYFQVSIPFSAFKDPSGYAGDPKTYADLPAALTGGLVPNELDIDLRMDGTFTCLPDSAIHTGYIDNVTTY